MRAATETMPREQKWPNASLHCGSAAAYAVPIDVRKLRCMADVRGFLASRQNADHSLQERDAAYHFIRNTLQRFAYSRCGRADKGTLRAFLMVVTGFSRSQITRLISQYHQRGSIEDHRGAPSRPFPRRYTEADVAALVELDALHGQLSGPITRKLCQRAWGTFGERRFQRLAGISNGHLYNLRRHMNYQRNRGLAGSAWWQRMPTGGDCRRRSDGRPGRLYVGLCRGSDIDGIEGLHHIDIVDAETKYRFIALVPHTRIDCLAALLQALTGALPFPLRSLHADGSREPVNRQIAETLNGLLRDGTTADTDAYAHACGCGAWPNQFNDFMIQLLSPYLNYHRLRMFAVERAASGGKLHKTYPYDAIATPYERLKALPDAASYLKPGLDFRQLDAIAHGHSDNEVAKRLGAARKRLLAGLDADC